MPTRLTRREHPSEPRSRSPLGRFHCRRSPIKRRRSRRGRLQAAPQHSVSGGQDRPTGSRARSGSHLRGRFSRPLVWIPTGARPARCAGRSPCRDLSEASELGARRGHPGLFRCHGPFMDDPFSRAPYRGQAHPTPDCEMAEGGHHGRWARDTQGTRHAARRGDFTNSCERLLALRCVRLSLTLPAGEIPASARGMSRPTGNRALGSWR